MNRMVTMSIAVVSGSVAMAMMPAHVRQGDDLSVLVWDVEDDAFCVDSLLELFDIQEMEECTKRRMMGRSYGDGCTMPWADLRYLVIPHYDGHGHVRVGEMVCNKAVAEDLLVAFKGMFKDGYAIERMVLIDDYEGDDGRSMAENNTSCFNYRRVAGSRRLSLHALGMAVDINPLYNPYVKSVAKGKIVLPAEGKGYVNRKFASPYKVDLSSSAYRRMRAQGFSWGGSWRSRKDYQHFQKK